MMPNLIHEAHEELVRLYQDGKIKPLIYRTVPFKELPEALESLESRGTYGKLVTRPRAA